MEVHEVAGVKVNLGLGPRSTVSLWAGRRLEKPSRKIGSIIQTATTTKQQQQLH